MTCNFSLVTIGTSCILPHTVILKNETKLIQHLQGFLTNKKPPWTLCYRASLHGWTSQDFHRQCDAHAPTVVLVKVENWIFGGFTDQTWQGKDHFSNFYNISIYMVNTRSQCSARNLRKTQLTSCVLVVTRARVIQPLVLPQYLSLISCSLDPLVM